MAIHVQHPRVPLSNFEVVILPEHDAEKVKGRDRENLLITRGALHHLALDEDELSASREAPWAELPRPWLGVLLGGKSRAYDLTTADVELMIRQLRASLNASGGGSVLFIPSRRTDPATVIALQKRIGVRELRPWCDGAITRRTPVWIWDR